MGSTKANRSRWIVGTSMAAAALAAAIIACSTERREDTDEEQSPYVGTLCPYDGGPRVGPVSPATIASCCPVGKAGYQKQDAGVPQFICGDFQQALCQCMGGMGQNSYSVYGACCWPDAGTPLPNTAIAEEPDITCGNGSGSGGGSGGSGSGGCGSPSPAPCSGPDKKSDAGDPCVAHAFSIIPATVDGGAGYCAVEPQWVGQGGSAGIQCCWAQSSSPPVIPKACATQSACDATRMLTKLKIYAGCVSWYDYNGFYTQDGGLGYFLDATGIPADAALYDSVSLDSVAPGSGVACTVPDGGGPGAVCYDQCGAATCCAVSQTCGATAPQCVPIPGLDAGSDAADAGDASDSGDASEGGDADAGGGGGDGAPEGGGGGGGCFVAGTPIRMMDGSDRPIERVGVGDQVLSYDPETGKFDVGRVARVFVRAAPATLFRINERTVATPEHPFYANGRWTPASELTSSDTLLGLSTGAPTTIIVERLSTPVVSMPGSASVYNLEIASSHTYFAGGLLVHNACKIEGP